MGLSAPTIIVRFRVPNATADELEANVALPVEKGLLSLVNIRGLESECVHGSVIVRVRFGMMDVREAEHLVRAAIESLMEEGLESLRDTPFTLEGIA